MAKAIRRGTNGALKPVFPAVKWVGRASMFCLGLSAMVVLSVMFALVMATTVAATAVPVRVPERSTRREERS
jgi:hypothetical protein